MPAMNLLTLHDVTKLVELLQHSKHGTKTWCNSSDRKKQTTAVVATSRLVYTMGHKKMCHFIWDHNSHVSWWIFTLLAPMETGKNTLSGITKFATLPQLCLYTNW